MATVTWDSAARIALVAEKQNLFHRRSREADAVLARAALNTARTGVLKTGTPIVAAAFVHSGNRIVFEANPAKMHKQAAICEWAIDDTKRMACHRVPHGIEEWSAARDHRHFAVDTDNTTLLIHVSKASGALEVKQVAHSGSIATTAISPDATLAAASTYDGRLSIWRTSTGTLVRTFKIHPGQPNTIAVDPQVDVVASASGWVGSGFETARDDPVMHETGVHLWNLTTGQELRSLHTDTSVLRLLFIDHSSRLAAITDNGQLYVWNTKDWRLLVDHTHSRLGPAYFVGPSADGRRIAVASSKGFMGPGRNAVVVYSTSHHGDGTGIYGLQGKPSAIALSPAGTILAVGFVSGLIRVFDLAPRLLPLGPGYEKIAEFKGYRKPVTTLAFNREGNAIVSGSSDGRVMTWRIPTIGSPAVDATIYKDPVGVYRARLKPSSALVGLGLFDGSAILWNANNHKLVGSFCCHSRATTSVRLSPDGTLFSSSSLDGTVQIWSVISKKLLHTFDVNHAVFDASISPDDHQLVVGTKNGDVITFSLTTYAREGVQKLKGEALTVDFSKDGRWIIAGSADGMVHVLDSSSLRRIKGPFRHWREVGTVALSPRKRYLAASSGFSEQNVGGDTIDLWNTASKNRLLSIPTTGRITSIKFFDHGRRIAGASVDGTVSIWDTKTGIQLARFGISDWAFEAVSVSPEGIVSGVDQNMVFRQWTREPALVLHGNALIRYTCAHVLSPELQRIRPKDAMLAPLLEKFVGKNVCAQ